MFDNLFSNAHKKIKGIIDHRKIDNDNEKVKKSQISILHPPSGWINEDKRKFIK